MSLFLALALSYAGISGCSRGLDLHGVGVAPRSAALSREIAAPAPLAVASGAPNVEDPAAVARIDRIPLQSGIPLNVASQSNLNPDGAIPPEPNMGANREAAVNEIRAKSVATAKKPPNVFDTRTSSAEQLSAEEQKKLTAELEAEAAANAGPAGSAAAAKKAAAAELLKRRIPAHDSEAQDNEAQAGLGQ